MPRNVRMPNGTLIRNVPDNISREEFLNRLGSAGYDVDQLLTPAQRAEAAKPVTPPAPKPAETKPEEAPEEEGRAWYSLSGKGLTKGFGTQLAEGAKQGVGGVRQSIIDQLPNSIDQLPPGVSYEDVDRVGGLRAYWEQVYGITSNEQLKAVKKQATERLKEERKASEKRVAEATPDDLTLLEQGIRGGGESLVRNLPGIVASIATRNPLPALASAGLQTGAESYGEARAEGLTAPEAARYAGVDAAIEVGTELLPTKFLIDALGVKTLDGAKRQLLKFVAGDMTTEQIATFGQSVNAYANELDQELEAAETFEEKLAIQARRQALTGIATAVSGGPIAAATYLAVRERDQKGGFEPPPEEPLPEEPAPIEPGVEPVRAREAPPPPSELAPALRGIEAIEAPPEVTEGLPPAVVDDAQQLLKLADEGKPIALFRARSLAKQLGIELDKNANKETTLNALREVLAAPVEAPAVEAPALPEIPAPEAVQVDVLAGKDIRPPTDDVYEVADANFNYPRMIGNETVPIEQLKGGVSEQSGERKRVDELAKQIASDDGYFSRIIVDQNNNVIEGQHRLEALRELGAKEVPVFKIEDMGDTYPIMKMEAAVKKAQPMREEQASQIVKQAMNAIAETGSVQGAYELEIPGFQKGYLAALNVIEPKAPKAEVPSEPVPTGVSEAVTGAVAGGTGLPVPRVGPAGPEVTEPPVAGLEPVSRAPERLDEGEAPRPAALEPTEQRFLSLDELNEATPAIPEQTQERAPSLRRELSKAKAEYDAGELTADDFANRAGDLLVKTQKERMVRPRVRGAEYIRERLLNAKRIGTLSDESADLAEWFVRQNPLLVADLGISIRQQPEGMKGVAGFYDSASRIATVFSSVGDTNTATHEILHHLERLMPTNIRAGIHKAYTRQLLKAQKNAKTEAEKAFFNAIVNYHYLTGAANKKAEYDKALSAIKNGDVPKSHYQYVNPSEFWAVNGSRIVAGRYGLSPTIVGQLKRWLREFIEKAKDIFGLKSDAAVIRALDSLAKADGKYRTEEMLSEVPVYLSVQPGKKPSKKPGQKPSKKPHDLEDFAPASLGGGGISSLIKKLSEQFQNKTLFKDLVRKFQNKHIVIDTMDDEKGLQGTLIITGPDRNNIASEIARAPNITDYIIVRRVDPAIREVQDAIKEFALNSGLSLKAAINRLSKIFIAQHEMKRRETKYLREVPLRNDIKIPSAGLPFVPAGTADMTPADYRAFLEKQRSKLPPDQAAQIQDVMRVLVNKFKSETGYSPKSVRGKKMSIDINDKIYDVIPRGTKDEPLYTPEALQAKIDEYNNSGPLKPLIDDVRAKLNRVQELQRELSKEANYWAPQVDSIVASYQWGDTYVPFQGLPGSDQDLDYSSQRLSGELAEVEQSWEGRKTDFEDPILQSFANAYVAASQAGRKDLLPVLVNNIKQGFIKVKSKDPEVVTFDERNDPNFDLSVLKGKNKILDYQPNGDVHVYELTDERQLESIKTPYEKANPVLRRLADFNSLIGQFHTRFNLNFPPMDFLVNSMTNFGLITFKEGFGQGSKYAAELIGNVLRTGLMAKSFNLSRVTTSRDSAALERLMSKDGFYRDALDFIEYGGSALYPQGFNVEDQVEALMKRVGPSKIIRTKEALSRWFDVFGATFEYTSRVAAYTTRLKDNVAKAKAQNVDVNNPDIMADLKREAATFALELMNFRKIGTWGRKMSAFYMFFKPAATGAVNFIKVIRTATTSAEDAIKNAEPSVWAQMDTQYDEEALQKEEANPKADPDKIAELQNRIDKKNENRRRFIENYNQRRKNALVAAPIFFTSGALIYAMAAAMAPDDDEGRNQIATDSMSRWTRYMRLPVPFLEGEDGKDNFLQMPWGFGAGAFPAAGAQFAALFSGNQSFEDFASNMVEIGLDSFMPLPASRISMTEHFPAWLVSTVLPSAARPLFEYTVNMDSLGNPIYDSRMGKYADAYSGGSRPSEWHNMAAKILLEETNGNVDWEPDTIAFALNTYADGPNALAENIFNMALVLNGQKESDIKRDIPFIKRFIGKMSNYDAAQFREASEWIKSHARPYRTFRDYSDPEQLDRYLEANPNIDVLTEAYESVVNGQLREISTMKKQIQRDPSLTPKERKEYLDDIQYNEDAIKRNFVETYKYYRFPEE